MRVLSLLPALRWFLLRPTNNSTIGDSTHTSCTTPIAGFFVRCHCLHLEVVLLKKVVNVLIRPSGRIVVIHEMSASRRNVMVRAFASSRIEIRYGSRSLIDWQQAVACAVGLVMLPIYNINGACEFCIGRGDDRGARKELGEGQGLSVLPGIVE